MRELIRYTFVGGVILSVLVLFAWALMIFLSEFPIQMLWFMIFILASVPIGYVVVNKGRK